MLSWKQSQFSHCSLWDYLFSQCCFQTISIYTMLCLKQSVSTVFWNNLTTASVSLFLKKISIPPILSLKHFQCCLETSLIAHCCFWNCISFLSFVLETVPVSLMLSLKQSHFPSTVFEAISVCLTSPGLSLKQSQFPQYCLWNKIDFPSVVVWSSLKFPNILKQSQCLKCCLWNSLNFPSFVFGTVSVASSLSWNSFTFLSVVFQNKIRFHSVVSEAALVSPKRLASVLIVVLKQFDYLQCCLWSSLRFPSVFSEAVVVSPKRLASVLIVVLKQFYFPQCCLWNSLRFPSVVSEVALVSSKDFHQSALLSWNSFIPILSLKQSQVPKCCISPHCCLETVLLSPVLSLKQSEVPWCCFWSSGGVPEKTCISPHCCPETVLLSPVLSLKQSQVP